VRAKPSGSSPPPLSLELLLLLDRRMETWWNAEILKQIYSLPLLPQLFPYSSHPINGDLFSTAD
jgi:hypothetical protein